MQTKAYFASSVPAAIDVARRELGPDAMLIGSRPAPSHARQMGRLEVTFAWTPAKGRHSAIGPAFVPGGHPTRASENKELEDIRRQLSALRAAVGDVMPAARDILAERLTEAGLDPEISREISTAAHNAAGDPESNAFSMIVARVRIAPFVPLKPADHKTFVFIGPPGRGKTTTLIKVALAKGLMNRTPVRVYSAGAHGIGGSEQMARYCSILGTPHHVFETLENLALALQGETWKGLTLIDTPGLSPADHEELAALAGLFARHRECEKHLVLRAESRYADMLSVIERFSVLQPDRLLFTGTDETRDWSAMVNTLIRTSVPVTFEGNGRGIPEDLCDADALKLVGAMLSPTGPARATAVQRAAA